MSTRGHHRIVLGMAAGVGKTYRALQDIRAAADTGRDAIVAYLEPHGRAATVAQAQGLELLARRKIQYGGTEMTELDVPGLLARAPELCLIDELAHTNAPGLEHTKRWQDVEEVLAAGIDVVSTVNVQHLESLNDLVAELTGIRVRETVPDRILAEADDVVLVDVEPRALLDRLRAGLVYPEDRIEHALNGFFRIENLAALRELALRELADDVDARRRSPYSSGVQSDDAIADVGERLLAWVVPGPGGAAVLRRAARSAKRLGAPLQALVTRPMRPPGDAEQRLLDELTRLSSELRAQLLIREGDDPVAIVITTAREQDTTYLLLATPKPRRWVRTGTNVIERLTDGLPGVDVRLVADRGRQRTG